MAVEKEVEQSRNLNRLSRRSFRLDLTDLRTNLEGIKPLFKKAIRLTLPGLVFLGSTSDCISHFISPVSADGQPQPAIVTPLAEIFDYTAPTYISQCNTYAHHYERINQKVNNKLTYIAEIYFPLDIPESKTKALDLTYQSNLMSVVERGSEAHRHYFGFEVTNQFIGVVEMNKRFSDYSGTTEIMTETISRLPIPIIDPTGKGRFTTLSIFWIANEAGYDRPGFGSQEDRVGFDSTEVSFLSGYLVDNYTSFWPPHGYAHEEFHKYGFRKHNPSQKSINYAGISETNQIRKVFDQNDTSKICNGGQAFLPVILNSLVPIK